MKPFFPSFTDCELQNKIGKQPNFRGLISPPWVNLGSEQKLLCNLEENPLHIHKVSDFFEISGFGIFPCQWLCMPKASEANRRACIRTSASSPPSQWCQIGDGFPREFSPHLACTLRTNHVRVDHIRDSCIFCMRGGGNSRWNPSPIWCHCSKPTFPSLTVQASAPSIYICLSSVV